MARSRVTEELARGGPVYMLHAGLDLSRRRLDVCLLSEQGERVAGLSRPDGDGVGL